MKPFVFPNTCIFCGYTLELDKTGTNGGNKSLAGKKKFRIKNKIHYEPERQFCSPLQSNAMENEGRECVRLNQVFEKLLYGKSAKINHNLQVHYNKNVRELIQIFLYQMIQRKPRSMMYLHLIAVLNGLAEPNKTMLEMVAVAKR